MRSRNKKGEKTIGLLRLMVLEAMTLRFAVVWLLANSLCLPFMIRPPLHTRGASVFAVTVIARQWFNRYFFCLPVAKQSKYAVFFLGLVLFFLPSFVMQATDALWRNQTAIQAFVLPFLRFCLLFNLIHVFVITAGRHRAFKVVSWIGLLAAMVLSGLKIDDGSFLQMNLLVGVTLLTAPVGYRCFYRSPFKSL